MCAKTSKSPRQTTGNSNPTHRRNAMVLNRRHDGSCRREDDNIQTGHWAPTLSCNAVASAPRMQPDGYRTSLFKPSDLIGADAFSHDGLLLIGHNVPKLRRRRGAATMAICIMLATSLLSSTKVCKRASVLIVCGSLQPPPTQLYNMVEMAF